MKFKKYISDHTEKIRYKLASLILKHLTPVLYKKIDISTFTGNRTFLFTTDIIPGNLRPSFRFMKNIFDGKLVKGAEIGVERGRNSKSILKELNIEKLYLIDPWINYEEIDNNWTNIDENYKYVLREFEKNKKVEIIKYYSDYAVNLFKMDSLDFVYIDANHSYEYVYQDISIWFPKVKKGGVIAGHDILLKNNTYYEVLEAVKNFCYRNNINFYINEPDWYFIKT
ncbi:hypothetical protein LCGC14_1178130 [marine sediment metagenome]|uniref:Methyltransferase domain-containing protein n=1 Tax=marine sediment metagenome TaxID=412755 RepID=A0A0F9LMZ3_9ZZZZ